MDEEFHWSNFLKRHSNIVKKLVVSLVLSAIYGVSGTLLLHLATYGVPGVLVLHFAISHFILVVFAILAIGMSVGFLLASVLLFCTIFD